MTSIASIASSTLMPPATSTSAAPAASSTAPSTEGNSTSQSLLFFVALGFGVVFTNLWIIVGVKYCYRYNRRNRLSGNGADAGDSIDLPNVQRPRRRREKKLMTMEEVNERFPLTKYKLWRISREQEGLPAAGGVTAPPSRAPSIKEVEQTKPADASSKPDSTANAISAKASIDRPGAAEPVVTTPAVDSSAEEKTQAAVHQEHAQSPDEYDDDDDPIRHAGPAVDLNQPGDSCAICIDNLEDDDEVRGLSCGHAFHASCIDPWLTGRRACCPLCKADYYVPKTRPEDAEAPLSYGGLARPPRIFVAGHAIPLRARFLGMAPSNAAPAQPQPSTYAQTRSPHAAHSQAVHWFLTIPQRIPPIHMPRFPGRRRPEAADATTQPSDSNRDLEAGPRP